MIEPRLSQITHLPSSPNEIINLLFDEEIAIQQGKSIKKGKGKIYLGWFPYPNTRFEIEIEYPPIDKEVMKARREAFKKIENESPAWHDRLLSDEKAEISDEEVETSNFNADDAILKISSSEFKVNIQRVGRHPTHKSFQNPRDEILGYLHDAQYIGDGTNVKYLQFYLTNFYARSFEIELEDWHLTLHAVENVASVLRALEREGGYCISHIARLERLNHENFDVEHAEELLSAISYGFSFMRGIRISPILISGFNQKDEVIYQEPGFYWVTPWEEESNFTCMTIPSEKDLNLFISKFLIRWKDDTWHKPLKLIIQWYTEAIRTGGGIEGSIVLLQTALETLSWVLIVEERGESIEIFHGKPKGRKTPASYKINRLLDATEISKVIPTSLGSLKNYSFEELEKKDNVPHAFCTVRNNIAR